MLPDELYTAAAVRRIESDAISGGVAGYALMQRAGAVALAALRRKWPDASSISVVAGPGNNGGDGLVLARLARAEGLSVTTLLVGEPGELRGEAGQALQDLHTAGMEVFPFDGTALATHDVIVDALLGIGVRAPLRPEWVAAIERMNACDRPILSLDLPSGLHPDSGRAIPAVRATATISFLALKQGLLLAQGPEHAGELLFDDLGVAASPEVPAVMRHIGASCLAEALPPRPRDSHKGMFGRVLVIGGGVGMPGAVRLAAEAALRAGAGLVRVASVPEHLETIVGPRPELMFHAVARAGEIDSALADADVVVIGPGLGRNRWAQELFERVCSQRRPAQRLVLDADALNLLASGAGMQHCEDWVLTPHPGEAARLLGVDTQFVQLNRLAALASLCERRGGTIVLKGAATLVGRAGELPRLSTLGNPGMSVAGMGDVLTGALAGILAQGASPLAAATAAVHAHALAGDRCALRGLRGILASEVAHELRAVLSALP